MCYSLSMLHFVRQVLFSLCTVRLGITLILFGVSNNWWSHLLQSCFLVSALKAGGIVNGMTFVDGFVADSAHHCGFPILNTETEVASHLLPGVFFSVCVCVCVCVRA